MKRNAAKEVGLGLLGLGTVGQGVAKILKTHGRDIERKTGLRFVLRRALVRSVAKKRAVSVPRRLLTRDPRRVWGDPQVDIVVELAGGVQPAGRWIQESFHAGKHVVTANKALLAEKGREIFGAALRSGRELGIEASVCGGIPILQAIRRGFASNDILSFLGIVNGTCNYILSAMSQGGSSFKDALAEAQKRGYAEANPALDIDGTDSAHKLSILARLAFRAEVPLSSLHVEGIRGISSTDIGFARELGYVVKLLAIGKKWKNGLELRVHPTLLPLDHPLAAVRGVYNAVFIHADQAGDLLFYGKGAGMMPTASAVMSDVLEIGRKISSLRAEPSDSSASGRVPVLPVWKLNSKYYLRFQVADRPGVLGRIAQILGENRISILSVHQKESQSGGSVPVVILTYEAVEKNLRRALSRIDSHRDIREKTRVFRVEN